LWQLTAKPAPLVRQSQGHVAAAHDLRLELRTTTGARPVGGEAKSNGITAIPKLLTMLSVQGCTVTIDALNCQREIARQIVDQNEERF
jgi:hypothetical protein